MGNPAKVGKAKCVCTECGEPFTWRAYFYKREFASKFKQWGEENIELCPTCRDKLRAKSWATEARYCVKLAKQLHLPPLEGPQGIMLNAEYARVHIFEAGPERGGEHFFDFIFETCTSASWWVAHASARSIKELIFLMKYSTKDKPILEQWKLHSEA